MRVLPLSRLLFVCAVVSMMFGVGVSPAWAQTVTTGTISGVVLDQQNKVLPGASVVAVHQPTGTRYETVTSGDGRFQIPNVRVGGPYTVTVSLSAFKAQTRDAVTVALGEDKAVDFSLELAGVTAEVNVVAQELFDATRAGTAANVPNEAITSLPTISRGLFDFARTSPYFSVSPDSAGTDAFLSVSGRNPRYNSIQIDGAVNNDVFGIPATGTPGAQTGSQPISLDAIQEVQLVVAPYDVRQGGFTGGGINAVTKSGSNRYSGTGYWVGRNQNLTRSIPALATPAVPNPADVPLEGFSDSQGGFSLGGPIRQNKAFFFGNLDLARRTLPTGFSGDGSGGQVWGGLNAQGVASHAADLQQISSIMKTQYGYDPGSLSEVVTPINSDKLFIRSDLNVTPRNQLTMRVNYINGSKQLSTTGVPNTTTWAYPTDYYSSTEKVWSPVVQLNSTFAHAFNEFRATYTYDRFARSLPSPVFPFVRVDFADGLNVRLGSENSSHANQLNQDIVEVTDDVTLVRGRHTFIIGTHNEFLHFYNVFVQNLYGNYEFAAPTTAGAIANLQAGVAQLYSRNFSNTSNPLEPAEFSVRQFGGYVGDQWRVASNVTLTYGVRLDAPNFPTTPHANPITVTDFGLRTDIVPAPKMWSPRIGFAWDLSHGGNARSIVRGGIGYFTGRTPYVWMSNQYGTTGVDFTNLNTGSVNNALKIPFVADPYAQPTSIPGGITGSQTINLIDPNYKYPAVVRGNLAYDRDLGIWGLIATGELLYSNNTSEIAYQNINYIPVGQPDKLGNTGVSATQPAILPDGRINFHKYDTTLNDVLLLTNTSLGSSWTGSVKVERPFRNGFNVSGSYVYNHSTSINDGTSSIAASNWANNPIGIDVNNPALTRSNNDGGHRVNVTAVVPIRLSRKVQSTAAVFYNGQSGRPYVILFNGNANGDGRSNNDIAFLPSSPDQVILTGGTWDQLDAYLNSDPASKNNRGTIPARNVGRAPFWNQLDFRYAVTVETAGKTRVEFTLDVFNLLNAFNKNWGWHYFPKFPNSSGNGLISYQGIDAATGKEKLNIATIASPTFQGTFDRDDQLSRAQGQIGLRFRF
jgi:hypothetical protein